MGDKIKIEGVLSKGYGIIPKLVMKDSDLTIEAKAIYAYISSYAGSGNSAFPSVSLICSDLDISENRFHKHKKVLVEKGYIEVNRERTSKGSWGSNVYTINSVINYQPSLQNDVMDEPTHQNPCMDKPTLDNPCMENEVTNNNSSINNSSIKQQQQPASENQANFITAWKENGFGDINQDYIKTLEEWIAKFDGNDSVVIKAIKVANELGPDKRNMFYLKTILKDWKNRGFKVGEDFDAAEEKRKLDKQTKKAVTKNKFNKGAVRKETIPEHILNPVTKETPMSEEEKEEFMNRLKKIQNLKVNDHERAQA